jgi:hypothetical protein
MITCQFRGEKLESDCAIELEVDRLVDNSHTTLAEFLEDFVVGDCLTYHVALQMVTAKERTL